MSNLRPIKPPISGWKILLLTAAVIVIYAVASLFNVYRKIPESYAAWTTGNLMVDYLNTHSNQWPRNWEDLERATNCQRYVPIEVLRTKVKIVWDTDFTQLLEGTRSNRNLPLNLITRPNGTKLHAIWGKDTEPNYKIKGYLLWVLTEPKTSQAVTTNNALKPQDSLQ